LNITILDALSNRFVFFFYREKRIPDIFGDCIEFVDGTRGQKKEQQQQQQQQQRDCGQRSLSN